MAERPQLHLIDSQTGEIVEDERDILIEQQSATIKGLQIKAGKLSRELKELRSVEPEAMQVREVLDYWRTLCAPRAVISPGGVRWEKVRARLKDKLEIDGEARPPWTVGELKLTVDGALLDPWLNGTAGKSPGYLKKAETIFKSPEQVERLVEIALGVQTDIELKPGAMIALLRDMRLHSFDADWLAVPCLCGHRRVFHARHGQEEKLPDQCLLPECDCGDFMEDFSA